MNHYKISGIVKEDSRQIVGYALTPIKCRRHLRQLMEREFPYCEDFTITRLPVGDYTGVVKAAAYLPEIGEFIYGKTKILWWFHGKK